MAGVAEERSSVASGGHMQAHPRRRQAIVGAVGVGAQCRSPWRTQGGRSTKTCRDKRGRKGDWDVPFRILSVTTHLRCFRYGMGDRSFLGISNKCFSALIIHFSCTHPAQISAWIIRTTKKLSFRGRRADLFSDYSQPYFSWDL